MPAYQKLVSLDLRTELLLNIFVSAHDICQENNISLVVSIQSKVKDSQEWRKLSDQAPGGVFLLIATESLQPLSAEVSKE